MFWSFRRWPIVLFTLFCTFFRCKLKSNLVSNTIPRCLWVDDDLTKFWLKYDGGWLILLIFLLKITSWACLLGSGLNIIFHWKVQLLIFMKSLFKSFAVEFISWTTENREVPSANNLGDARQTNKLGDAPRTNGPEEKYSSSQGNCPKDKLHPIYFSPTIRKRSTLIDSCFLLFSFFVG